MSERSRSRSSAEASTDDVAQRGSAVLSPRLLREWPLPVPDGGKHARGTVLVIGGAPPTVGAVLLAGVAALRAGAGVLQLAVAQSRAAALAVAVPDGRQPVRARRYPGRALLPRGRRGHRPGYLRQR